MSNLRPLLAALALVLGAGCSSPRYEVARPVSHALERPGDTSLGRTHAAQLAATPGQSGFHLLVSDQAFLVALAEPRNERSPLVWSGSENGKPASFTSEPLAGWWRRFVSAILGALAPEEML